MEDPFIVQVYWWEASVGLKLKPLLGYPDVECPALIVGHGSSLWDGFTTEVEKATARRTLLAMIRENRAPSIDPDALLFISFLAEGSRLSAIQKATDDVLGQAKKFKCCEVDGPPLQTTEVRTLKYTGPVIRRRLTRAGVKPGVIDESPQPIRL